MKSFFMAIGALAVAGTAMATPNLSGHYVCSEGPFYRAINIEQSGTSVPFDFKVFVAYGTGAPTSGLIDGEVTAVDRAETIKNCVAAQRCQALVAEDNAVTRIIRASGRTTVEVFQVDAQYNSLRITFDDPRSHWKSACTRIDSWN